MRVKNNSVEIIFIKLGAQMENYMVLLCWQNKIFTGNVFFSTLFFPHNLFSCLHFSGILFARLSQRSFTQNRFIEGMIYRLYNKFNYTSTMSFVSDVRRIPMVRSMSRTFLIDLSVGQTKMRFIVKTCSLLFAYLT